LNLESAFNSIFGSGVLSYDIEKNAYNFLGGKLNTLMACIYDKNGGGILGKKMNSVLMEKTGMDINDLNNAYNDLIGRALQGEKNILLNANNDDLEEASKY